MAELSEVVMKLVEHYGLPAGLLLAGIIFQRRDYKAMRKEDREERERERAAATEERLKMQETHKITISGILEEHKHALNQIVESANTRERFCEERYTLLLRSKFAKEA